jgi:serine/threonine-protein kinase
MGVECPKCKTENTSDSEFCKKCATPLPSSKEIPVTETLETPAEELTTGSIFAGRYKIIEELGKGGMGKVYKAIDKKLNEEVALKLIKPEIASDKKTLERFNNELKFARKIAHKNVGRMYELMEEKGTHFITMEYVPGQDLRGLIRQTGQLTVGTALSITKQVCEGLTEAHRLGVIHRDLKPQNIMIDKEGMARIMDFGIARSVSGKGITGAGVMVGTPEYMSPEQVESKETDQRSDIYSLGIILYEMVTGRVPFEGDTPLSVAVKHKTEAPPDPKQVNTQIPEDLSHLILRCMEKNKENRFQSAGEVSSVLEKIEKGIPTTERIVPKRKPEPVKIGEIKWKKSILYSGAVVLLILIIIAGFYLFVGPREAIDTIAVLPFENVNESPETEYLCDGVTESLINKLSQLPTMKRVIARGSVFRYKGKEIDPQAVGKELGVNAVLISQLSQHGDELSISVELMNVRDNSHIWGKQYKRTISEIFVIQEEISNSIIDSLKLKLTREEKQPLTKRYTENTEAYQLYMKGRYFWNKRTEDAYRKAIEYFEEAIKKDPSYALAYTGMADCYNLIGNYAYLRPEEAYPKAKEAALKALNIDNALTEAHTSLAFVLYDYDWDWEGAESEYKRAIELNPGYATNYHWYAFNLSNLERHDEAIAAIKRAQELDPLSLIINNEVGHILYKARQYDKAIEAFQKTLEMNPEFWKTHQDLARTYLEKGMYGEAIKEIQKAKEFLKGWRPSFDKLIGTAYVRMGKIEEAQQVLDNLLERSKQVYVSPDIIAKFYFALGENDQGFKWLERAYEDRTRLTDLRVSPAYDSVRSHPRFKALLKKMNLE